VASVAALAALLACPCVLHGRDRPRGPRERPPSTCCPVLSLRAFTSARQRSRRTSDGPRGRQLDPAPGGAQGARVHKSSGPKTNSHLFTQHLWKD